MGSHLCFHQRPTPLQLSRSSVLHLATCLLSSFLFTNHLSSFCSIALVVPSTLVPHALLLPSPSPNSTTVHILLSDNCQHHTRTWPTVHNNWPRLLCHVVPSSNLHNLLSTNIRSCKSRIVGGAGGCLQCAAYMPTL